MKGPEIRKLLLASIGNSYTVYEELGIMEGHCIVDVAVVSSAGLTCGYEIKSDCDSLKRIPRQVEAYSKIFDYCSVVITEKHLRKIKPLIPASWGVIVATTGIISGLTQVRGQMKNDGVDPAEFVRLLWMGEAYRILQGKRLARGMSGSRKHRMLTRLVENVPFPELKDIILRTMAGRAGWKK